MSFLQSFIAGVSIGLIWLIGFAFVIYVIYLSRIRVFTTIPSSSSSRLTNADSNEQ